MIRTLNVWDMDGCIVDSSHRYKTLSCGEKIDLPFWIANEHLTFKDSLLPLANVYQNELLNPEVYTIIATARIWCEQTEKFVRNILGYPNAHFARKSREDLRGGAALKITGVKKLLNLKQFQGVETIHVFEDNASYLKEICDALPNAIGHYFPSIQGH